jgi:hypothetical protein
VLLFEAAACEEAGAAFAAALAQHRYYDRERDPPDV